MNDFVLTTSELIHRSNVEKNIAKYTKEADKLAMEAQVQNMSLIYVGKDACFLEKI